MTDQEIKNILDNIHYRKESTFKENYPLEYQYINEKYTFKKFMSYNGKCKICNDFCSGLYCSKCTKSDQFKSFLKEKIEAGQIKKYGSLENFYAYFNNKSKETIRERYGVENISQLDETKNKIIKNNLEKYGVENISQIGTVKEKKKKTNLERYGSENYLLSEDFKEKNKQTNLKKLGVEHNKQSHFKNIENLNEDFVEQNFIKDGKFFIHKFTNFFNMSKSTGFYYKDHFNIKEPNKISTCKTQQFIFDQIKSENKIFNDRSLEFEIDILIPDKNLGIEYDGLMYHSRGLSLYQQFKNTHKNYHLDKTEACLSNGVQLFHIFEGEDLDLWLSMINNKLGLNSKIYARKCIIKELESRDCKTFLEENHLQSYIPAQINIGLFYNFSENSGPENIEDYRLVSLMTFSKPRFNKNYEYELIRFCSLKGFNVVGGASKLFKYFIKTYNPKSIITYANRRFSNGDIYKKLGFTFLEKTNPNYFYFKSGSTVLESRNKYQKHKLKDLLDEYDPELSEAENMFNNGYRRIYDCGNLKFEWVRD